MRKLIWLLLLTVVLSACSGETVPSATNSSAQSVYQELSAHAVAVKSAAVPTEAQQMSVIKLFQAMFNATPGADLFNLCSGWLAGGMTESELANMIAGTELFKSASFYPDSLSNLNFSLKYLDNLFGSTVSTSNKAALASQMATFLDGGWKRGDLMLLLVSALSNLATDPTWGNAAVQLSNRLNVSYYYSVTKAVPSADLVITASVTNDPATVTAAKASIDRTNPTNTRIFLPRTGKITSDAAGDDGALQKGVAWPNPRFADNSNGTVTDNLTGLVWLKNANCFSSQYWSDALASANKLAAPACGLTDGSTAGQWHLPNINELESLVDLNNLSPALPTGHPFTNVQSGGSYWSSSTLHTTTGTNYAWHVGMTSGNVNYGGKTFEKIAWPVRARQ